MSSKKDFVELQEFSVQGNQEQFVKKIKKIKMWRALYKNSKRNNIFPFEIIKKKWINMQHMQEILYHEQNKVYVPAIERLYDEECFIMQMQSYLPRLKPKRKLVIV